MGRTQRKRNKKKMQLNKFHTCENDKEIVLLNTWLAEQGIRRNVKLVLATFDTTGRGVLTKKKIKAREELIQLPLNLTINVTTILMDTIFCSIFLENKKECLLEYEHTVSFQALLSFYLIFLKVQGISSNWYTYLESLPKKYTVPYFLPNDVKCNITTDVLSVISKQKGVIEKCFCVFKDILANNTSNKYAIKLLRGGFNLSDYEWAYFTVNTRCVYMDLANIIDLKNVENTILNIVCDNTKISLCPYLDMINHSPNAKNETKLVVSRNVENVNIRNLTYNLLSNVHFSIYTKDNFEPYTQVFICYGDSHNLKLITEYGFYLPNNDLDFVVFDFENIIEFLATKSIKLSQDQLLFINSHSLYKDLYIDFRGLSFNFYALLMVVKYYYKENMDVSKLIYSAAICSSDELLNDLITPMVRDTLENIKVSIKQLEFNKECNILSNCIFLMCQYVNILEKFIKC